MISPKISELPTPNVSPFTQFFPPGTCRYCGCHGNECRVPEGQYGYRSCFWLDDERTVCTSPTCTEKWYADKPSINAAKILGVLLKHRGLQIRVARKLGLSRSMVNQPDAQALTSNVVSIARGSRRSRHAAAQKKISFETVVLIAGLAILFLGFVVGFILGQAVSL